MNLVAKEFVVAQDPEDPGVLVLSRFAGAECELHSALIVNPYDREGVSIDRALSMPLLERRLVVATQKLIASAERLAGPFEHDRPIACVEARC